MNKSTYRLGLLTVAVGLTLARPAASSAQNLYAASFGNTIQSYTPDGTATQFASTGLNGPFGLAFDAAGNLYSANRTGNTIEMFTPAGVASVFASTGLNQPTALAFDAAGNLYAANLGNNTIEKIAPDGTATQFASLSNPTALAFVPEPSAWAAVLAGAGLLGFVTLRQRRRAERA